MKLRSKLYVVLVGVVLVSSLAGLAACAGSSPPKQSGSTSPQAKLPPAPDIQVSALAVNPPEIDAGVDALITARVTNTGPADQDYVGEVKVENGKSLPEFWYTPQVTIPAGDTKLVSLVINENQAGTYRVNWSGLSGDLVVKPVVLTEPGKPASSVTVNVTAPDFSATELISGQKLSLSQYKGKVVLLNFVNYGCDPRLNGIVDKQFQAIKQLASEKTSFRFQSSVAAVLLMSCASLPSRTASTGPGSWIATTRWPAST